MVKYLQNLSAWKKIQLALILLIILALPLFLLTSKTRQDNRQKASSSSLEAEAADLTGQATKSDQSASGGKYLHFGNESIGNTLTPLGWDYGLKHRCLESGFLKSSNPADNYFKDFTDCSTPPPAPWTIGFESEKSSSAGSCPGPVIQSFPINRDNSPASLNWIANPDGLWTLNLKTDWQGRKHPCGTGFYNWYVLFYPLESGDPTKMTIDSEVNYNDAVPSDPTKGGSRGLVGFSFVIPGVQQSYEVEINFNGSNTQNHWSWDINNPVAYTKGFDFGANNYRHFFTFNGKFLEQIGHPQVFITKGQTGQIHLDLGKIITWMSDPAQHLVPKLAPGQTYKFTGSYIGTENVDYQDTGSVVSDIYIRNYRINSQ